MYVALELGSSHLSGLLAYKDALGRVVPMASRRVERKGSIVHGTIYNIDVASDSQRDHQRLRPRARRKWL